LSALPAFACLPAVPIAFGFGLATFGYLALTTGTPLMVLVGRMDEGMSHLILLSVPLFVFLGLLIEMTGMARAMWRSSRVCWAMSRGGLHYVLVGAMYLVSGISGSKPPIWPRFAPVLFPEMIGARRKTRRPRRPARRHRRADRNHPAQSRADHHRLVTGVSIAALFTGGLLPGVGLAITLSALVWCATATRTLRHVTRAAAGRSQGISGRPAALALPS